MIKIALQLFITALSSALLLGCSEPPLPDAEPLNINAQQLAKIPYSEPGLLQVVKERSVLFTAPTTERDLQLSIFYPSKGQNYPLLFFSHGNWSTKDKYDNLINFWVSHGYVVIAPNHLDCCSMASGIFNSLRYGNFGLIEQRINDFKLLIDHYEQLETSLPALKGKGDINNVALVGHSFGAFTAQQFGGAGTFNTDDEQYHFYADPRIKAIVAISPPGPMFDEITPQSWQQLATPTLITTGTWDIDSHFFTQWQLHKMSFNSALPGDKYALVTQGADHYLGNLICRPERDVVPQRDALIMLNASSTTFLASYLKEDEQAKAFLQSGQLSPLTGGFSAIEYR